MSTAEGWRRKGGYSVPIPVIERLRSPNWFSVPFWDVLEGDMVGDVDVEIWRLIDILEAV